MANFSSLILTRNEALNLPACLAALGGCDDIVVLDSNSEDDTRAIARRYGARVFQRPFDDYAGQRNYGLHQLEFKYEWVLMIDADEILTSELEAEIDAFVSSAARDTTLVFARRKDFLFGRWLKHSSGYPTWFGRLMQPRRVWVERGINEEYHTQGQSAYLQGHLHHYPFNKGFKAWFDKHNRYSSMESELLLASKGGIFVQSATTDTPAMARRKRIKALAYRLPLRPLVVFTALFFLRRGFLDGRAGLIFCCLRGCYEFMIDCKLREARYRRAGRPV